MTVAVPTAAPQVNQLKLKTQTIRQYPTAAVNSSLNNHKQFRRKDCDSNQQEDEEV